MRTLEASFIAKLTSTVVRFFVLITAQMTLNFFLAGIKAILLCQILEITIAHSRGLIYCQID